MPRASRREEVLAAALSLFLERGFEGTAIADIADAVGVSKAAVSYHFPAKDDLLLALADPPLTALERVVEARGERPAADAAAARELLQAHLDVLLEHGDVVAWLDTDRGVLVHARVGPRIEALRAATRRALGGGDGDVRDVAAAAALGVLWRPARNLDAPLHEQRALLVDAALAVLASVGD